MNKELDWPRIARLMKIGIAAALMVLAGDMLLGWGVHDAAKSGMEGFLSGYLNLSDGRIFWSALLGLIGIPLEALCYFAVYRLIVPYSQRLAHAYRSGILGVLAFGGCGVHVPCLACVFFYKYMTAASPETALDASVRFGLYFLLPGMILFFIFWLVLTFFPETPLRNALTAGWISVGNLWMFGGLLAAMKKGKGGL